MPDGNLGVNLICCSLWSYILSGSHLLGASGVIRHSPTQTAMKGQYEGIDQHDVNRGSACVGLRSFQPTDFWRHRVVYDAGRTPGGI